jgi:hypothetical protein
MSINDFPVSVEQTIEAIDLYRDQSDDTSRKLQDLSVKQASYYLLPDDEGNEITKEVNAVIARQNKELCYTNAKLHERITQLLSDLDVVRDENKNLVASLEDRDENARAAKKLRKKHEKEIKILQARLDLANAIIDGSVASEELRVANLNANAADKAILAIEARLNNLTR